MNVEELLKLMSELASEKNGKDWDEYGLIFGDKEKDVFVLGVTWRPTLKVLKEAAEKKVDLLIVHERLFQPKPETKFFDESILTLSPNDLRKKVLTENNITVLRYHLSWDAALQGNAVTAIKLLGLKNVKSFFIGGVGEITTMTIEKLLELVKQKFGCEKLLVTPFKPGQIVSKIALVPGGANAVIDFMEKAKQNGAEVFISGDVKDSTARYAVELGLILIDAGHYFTENPGVKNLAEILKEKLPEIKVLFFDAGKPWNFK
ncbi:MAG: Nif3-like dinuclear metal center hexameric protein [archaeon]